MNKDVIYIEPEDDITDIITKIENSEERIVALVPPRKAGVFRSVVNIKLIAKSGASKDKTIVLVTTDPSIIKLAAAVRMPVTKNLQSAPAIPTEDVAEPETQTTEVIEISEEKSNGTPETEASKDEPQGEENLPEKAEPGANPDEFLDDEDEKDQKGKKKKDKKDKSGNWFAQHKKLVIFGSIGGVALIGVLVWALVFAPAVTVNITVQAEQENFSENATFVTNLADEKAGEGKFYIEQKKYENTSEVNFDATGQKNNGARASGTVVVSTYFKDSGAIAINTGSIFSVSGLSYVSSEDTTLSWDGQDLTKCDNKEKPSLVLSGCQVSARVKVSAAEPGSKYNIAAAQSGWSTAANVGVYSDAAMTGGTDDIVTVVQQSDVEAAKSKLTASSEETNKSKLLASISKDSVVIDSSFKQTESAVTSTPAVGEVVGNGVKPTLKVTTTATVYVIDKTKLIQFISEKANIESDQKIYEVNDPRVENFSVSGDGYVGKIKTTYLRGPSLVESDIMERIRGRGIGDAQYELRRISGISDVKITTSYPWVTSVPNDAGKITIHADVKQESTSK